MTNIDEALNPCLTPLKHFACGKYIIMACEHATPT